MAKKPFYGWTVLGALFMIYMASNGIMQNTWPAIFRAVTTEFKIPQDTATFIQGLPFLIMAVLLPIAGYLATTFSPKRMIVYGCIYFIACVGYFQYVSNIEQLKIYYILLPIGLTLGGLLTSMIIINNWFYKYKGVAVGIFLNASSIGAAIFNPIAGSLIEKHGWRTTSFVLAIVVALMVLIPLFFIRNKPADKNTFPDGNSKRTNFNTDQIVNTPKIYAVKDFNFWLLILITGALWFVITGFIFNQQFYLKQLNLDAAKSGLIVGLFFFCSLIGKIIFGWLSDRYDKKNILIFSVINLIIGVVLLRLSLGNGGLIYVTAIVMGIGYSGCFTMIQLIIAHLYTGKMYSKVLGFLTMVDTFAAFAGIVLTGKWAKELGGYSFPFEVYIYLSAAALLAILLLKKNYKKA